jgi:hypothetical protein
MVLFDPAATPEEYTVPASGGEVPALWGRLSAGMSPLDGDARKKWDPGNNQGSNIVTESNYQA